MASDVGVKLNVSGISQFKSAMNSAKGSVKQLDAELKLNAAQYKASGDAEEYMAGRSRILSQQIKSQEQVVENAQKALEAMASQGVDKASASYTQMAAQLAKAKTDLLNMQQAAKSTGDELDEMGKSADTAGKSLEHIDKGIRFQNITTALGKVENMLESMWNHAVNIGKTIAGWERGSSDWADTLITDATKYGLDVETLQRYQYASKLIDTDVETIIKAQDKLLSLTKPREITDQLTKEKQLIYDTYAAIDINGTQYAVKVRDTNRQLLDQTEIFWNFLGELQNVTNETDRNALAQEYLGKSYRELLPLINAGRVGWEKAAESASVVDEEYVNALGLLNDKYVEFDTKVNQLSQTLAGSFAPAMQEILDVVGLVSEEFVEWLQSDEGKQAVKNLSDAIVGLVGGLKDIDFKTIFQGATDAVNGIAGFLENITGEDIITGLTTIGAIIAGWTVGKPLLEFMAFTKAFNNGGSGASSTTGGVKYDTVIDPKYKESYNDLKKAAQEMGVNVPAYASTQFGGITFATALLGAEVFKGILNPEVKDAPGVPENVQKDLEEYFANNKPKTGKDYSQDEMDAAILRDIERRNAEAAAYEAERENELKILKWYNQLSNYGVTDDEVRGHIATMVGLKDAPDEMLDQWESKALASVMSGAIEEYMIPGIADNVLDALSDYIGQMYSEWARGGDTEEAAEAAEGPALSFIDALTGATEEYAVNLGDAGSTLAEMLEEGVLSLSGQLYAAGAALANAFAAGASAIGGAFSGNTSYNNSYVGAVNVYGAQSPAEIAAAYNSFLANQQAGYGG